MAFLTAPNIPTTLAGGSAADPILVGVPLDVLFGASTLDVNSVLAAAIDQATGAVVSNIRASLSPAFGTATNGTAGSYDDTTKQLTIASTAGLGAGDYLQVQHASINSGVSTPVRIASVVNGTAVTMSVNPFNTLGNKTGVAYQVDWRFGILAGSGGSVSSAGGTANYAKFQANDSAGNSILAESTFYVRDAPAGAAFISIGAQDGVAGASGNTATPALSVLSGWANRGGIVTLAWANHSVQARNDFKWNDGTTTEKTLAAATGANLTLTAGDGMKYGRLVMRSSTGSAVTVERDVSYSLDSTAPTIVMYLAGR